MKYTPSANIDHYFTWEAWANLGIPFSPFHRRDKRTKRREAEEGLIYRQECEGLTALGKRNGETVRMGVRGQEEIERSNICTLLRGLISLDQQSIVQ